MTTLVRPLSEKLGAFPAAIQGEIRLREVRGLLYSGGEGMARRMITGWNASGLAKDPNLLRDLADTYARLEVYVDGRLRTGRDVTVPAAGSTTVRLSGAWGRCWQRASVVLEPVAGTGTALADLVPRPLTLDGPGLGVAAGTACAR